MAIPMTIIIKKFSRLYDGKAAHSKKRKILGGTFDENGEHIVTIEKRKTSRRKEQTIDSIVRHREGDTLFKRIISTIRKSGEP